MECAWFQLSSFCALFLTCCLKVFSKTAFFWFNFPMCCLCHPCVVCSKSWNVFCRGDDEAPLSSSIFLQLWMLQLEMVFLVACAFP